MIENAPRSRGFTLIELMVVVAIIGLLSSVAMPVFQRAVLRARAAERESVMDALFRATQDVTQARQCVPDTTQNPSVCPTAGAASSMAGGANPAGTPGPTKRGMDWTLAGWRDLPMIVQGQTFYSYSFAAVDPGNGGSLTMWVSSVGDLDGDGTQSIRTWNYVGAGYSFRFLNETPPPGTNPTVF